MEISFTRLRIFLECPWKYKLFFEERKRIPPHPDSALGVVLHKTLERFHRRQGEGWADLQDAYEAEFLSAAEPHRRRGERILRKWLEDEQSRRSELLGLEREFIFPLGRHTVRGMIDRIDRTPEGKVEIIDYKTQLSFGPTDPVPAPPGENLQLRFYGLGAKECFGYAPELLTIHYLGAGRRESSPYDASREAELLALIEKTADAIEAGERHPDTSFCPRCDFRHDCRFSAAKPA